MNKHFSGFTPTLADVVEGATSARWWLWTVLFALAALVSMLTDGPNAMVVALATLGLAMLATFTAPAYEGDAA